MLSNPQLRVIIVSQKVLKETNSTCFLNIMNNTFDEEYKEETKEENSDVTDIIGYWGKWQLLYFAILLFLSFPAGWFNFSRIFMAPNIDYWCAKPAEFVNMTTEEWKNFSIPLELIESKQVYSKCEMYSVSSGKNRTRIPCTSWEYDHSFYTSTITEKWDLVCDRAWIASFAQLMYFVGFLIAVFFGGQLSDKFGRKPMFYLTSVWTFIFSMISIFTSSVWLFVACRFLLALGRPNTTQIIYVHATEIVRKEYRIAVGLTCKLGYIIGQFVLPGLVWIFRDWFYIEIIYVLPCLICLPLWWVTSESPRWLITQGKIYEAEKVIRKAIKINKLEIQNFTQKFKIITEKIVKEKEGNDKQATFLDIMKNSHLRKSSLILCLTGVTSILSYFGLSFSADDIGVDILYFFFIAAVVEIPASIVYFYLQRSIGRRYTLILSMAGSGLVYLLAIAVQSGYPIILIVLTVTSRFCVSIALSSLYLFVTEIYPTVVRSVGMGLISMTGRIGALAAPFMKESANNVHISFPFALFGTLSIISSILTLFLPETKDLQLVDTLSQVENRKRNILLVHGNKAENEEKEEN